MRFLQQAVSTCVYGTVCAISDSFAESQPSLFPLRVAFDRSFLILRLLWKRNLKGDDCMSFKDKGPKLL